MISYLSFDMPFNQEKFAFAVLWSLAANRTAIQRINLDVLAIKNVDNPETLKKIALAKAELPRDLKKLLELTTKFSGLPPIDPSAQSYIDTEKEIEDFFGDDRRWM